MPIVRTYYNELDPFAADWLDNLMRDGLIPLGDIDRRSIRDVHARDLRGYTSHHFFAGIGGWPYALRLAGWPDDLPVWTGSCPCQPFSCAGKQLGVADDRHLWPTWYSLLIRYQPAVVFGEQIASKLGRAWLASVRADVEELGYEFGGADLCAAGEGAPHIRQRLYWVADAESEQGEPGLRDQGPRGKRRNQSSYRSATDRMADTMLPGRTQWRAVSGNRSTAVGSGDDGGLADSNGRHSSAERQPRGREQRQLAEDGGVGRLGDASGSRGGRHPGAVPCSQGEGEGEWGSIGREPDEPEATGSSGSRVGDARSGRRQGGQSVLGGVGGETCGERAAQADGPSRPSTTVDWSVADWLPCRDGVYRPVEPGAFPLAHGVPNRVGRLRAYGNAVVPQVAATFVRSYMEARGM